MIDIQRILQLLPHRYPFLLVDRVLEIEKGVRIKALKNVTYNEPFFTGHFPARPVMPGVLMLEALAQAAALLSFESQDAVPDEHTVVYFAGIDNALFFDERTSLIFGDAKSSLQKLVSEMKAL